MLENVKGFATFSDDMTPFSEKAAICWKPMDNYWGSKSGGGGRFGACPPQAG